MIHFFSNHKIIFKLTNLVLMIIYLYPGSLAGFVVYNFNLFSIKKIILLIWIFNSLFNNIRTITYINS